jgi:endoglucanase
MGYMQRNFTKIWLALVLCVSTMAAATVIPNTHNTNNTTAYAASPPVISPATCLLRFNDMFASLTSASSGYLSVEGVPYHSIETLMCERPDYGHMSTSEAFSFYVWLGAVKGKISGDWSTYTKAWDIAEKYIIPSSADQPGVSAYNPSSPATYAPESPNIEAYPTTGNPSIIAGADPLSNELNSAYGTKAIYQMHRLLDVDNWYKYGNHGDGASRCSYINTYQRGVQESCWETVNHPEWETFKWGKTYEGFLSLFHNFGTPAKQWRYTSATDADGRQIQASYWAYVWASSMGSNISPYTAKASKMGDYLQLSFFDKYFRRIGAGQAFPGTGYDSAHFLMSGNISWGGAFDSPSSWRISSSHCHWAHQNPMVAYVMANEPAFSPKTATGKANWTTSLARQIELYNWLQSAEGAIAGGVTNSWNGAYEAYPAGIAQFHGMAYDWQPVCHDPPGNQWFGFQAWSMERMIEYYYVSGNATAKAISDKWINWAMYNTRLHSGGTYEVPNTLAWSGQPGAGLSCSIIDYTNDIGVTSAYAKCLIYYAAACEKWAGGVHATARDMAGELLDRIWILYRNPIGVACDETRNDYSRFFDVVYIPSGWTGTTGQGATIKTGNTFIDLRPDYRNDVNWTKVQAAHDSGTGVTMKYHRWWAQAAYAIANGLYYIYFNGTSGPTPTPGGSTPAPATVTPTPVRTVTPVVTPTPSPIIIVQSYNQSTAATTNQIYLYLKLINTGTSAITLSDVKMRYYYTIDGVKAQNFYCDFSSVGSANVTGTFVTMTTPIADADTYLEVGFSSGAGSLAANGGYVTVQARIAKIDFSNYTQTNDYSFNPSATSPVTWPKVTAYVYGVLVWGPGTPSITPTPSSVITPTPVVTPSP